MTDFLTTETTVVALMLVFALVAIAVRRLRVPYTVALVIVGLLITIGEPVHVTLSPDLILGLLVPPLVFEASFQLNLRELRRSLPAILILAVPGVIVTMLVVGGLVFLGTRLPLPVALLFGALISATDPVSVVALFRRLSVPGRLSVLVEGESLFNDGTAIVLFDLVLGMLLSGHPDLLKSGLDFLWVSLGGVLVGSILGWLVSNLISRVDDYLIEITFTTILAFGAYLIAERLHVSGVLAVVAAGLTNGNLGPRGMSPSTRIVLFNFWEYIAFLANSLVFLLIGTQVDIPLLAARWQAILWAVAAVLAARVIVVYGLPALTRRIIEPIPLAWLHVLSWGGLRGAISLALALSLPAALGPDQEILRVMTFGVVLFTLLVQGTSMGWVIDRLHIIRRSQAQVDYERSHARLTAVRAAQVRLDHLHRQGLISTQAWEALRPEMEQRVAAMADALRGVLRAEPALEAQELDTARREMLRAQRSALLGLRRDGVIAQDVYEQLSHEIDAVLVGERLSAHANGSDSEEPNDT